MSDQVIGAGWENYKSLPDGQLDFENADSLLLEGPNGAGKTSIMQIFSMLAREGESEEPLKHGAEEGKYWLKVIKDGHEWLLRRVFNINGRDSYLLKKDGEPAKNEQNKRLNPTKKWFREFFNAPKFDPGAITQKKMKDMVDELFLLADYDGSAHDKKYAELYAKRHEVGVRRKIKDGHIQDLAVDSEDVLKYTSAIDVMDLTTEIAQAQVHGDKVKQAEKEVAESYRSMMRLGKDKERIEAEILRLQKELEEVKVNGKEAKAKWMEKKAEVSSLEANVPDLSGLEEKLASANEHNKKVTLVQQYQKAREEWEQADEDWKEYDRQMQEVMDQKIQEVLALKFVDPNLFISCEEKDNKAVYEVRYKTETGDVPFREGDLNTAKLIEVGIKLKLDALKRLDKFPVLRLDCSAMDQTTIEQVVDMLAAGGVFGVLEKALGRQGVDTLQYRLIESEAKKGSLEGASMQPSKRSESPPSNPELDKMMTMPLPDPEPEPPFVPEETEQGEIDLAKMFDDPDGSDDWPF